VVGNWAMHLNHYEANKLVQHLAHSLTEKELTAVEVVVLPPFTAIRSVQTAVDGDRWLLRYGAQDISAHTAGYFPGEVSGAMLAKLGVTYAVVGQYARRSRHHEDDAVVAAKVRAALAAEIAPVLCVGDPAEEHESDTGIPYTVAQVEAALSGLSGAQAERVVLAYEPVWAGAGLPAPAGNGPGEAGAARQRGRAVPLDLPPDVTTAQVSELAGHLRAKVAKMFGASVAEVVRIVYGGRVNGVTVAGYVAESDIDGVFVGELSLDPVEFAKICRLGEREERASASPGARTPSVPAS
jgi:triosephosphate isomerase